MTPLVMKFGGTSLADVERIRRVAELVAAEVAPGRPLAVVTSAMAGRTNEMVAWTDAAGRAAPGVPDDDAEYDAVVASGEQVTAGLLAQTLRHAGVPARSWAGWQVPILTDEAHGKARIAEIPVERLRASLDAGEVAVVAGFQGVTRDGRITTLGRGGSDTSAVAVAATLGARCDIYTDVDGVYTADPRMEPRARRLTRISHAEMLELAALGAKVLQTRSVELAMTHKVPLRVLSSFKATTGGGQVGTIVCAEEEIMERRVVSGVAYSRDEARIALLGLPDRVGAAAEVFAALAAAEVSVHMIVQSAARADGAVNLEFTVGRRDAARAAEAMRGAQGAIGFGELRLDEDVAKVSVVGTGLRSHPGVAETLFRALAERNVRVQAISTSEIAVSVLIEGAYTEIAVRALHAAFGLDKAD